MSVLVSLARSTRGLEVDLVRSTKSVTLMGSVLTQGRSVFMTVAANAARDAATRLPLKVVIINTFP